MWASQLIMPSSSLSSSSDLVLVVGLSVVGCTVVGASVVNAGTFCSMGVEPDGPLQDTAVGSQVVPLGQQCL